MKRVKMGTFSVSMPDEEADQIDEEARKNQRSRAAQVRIILLDWLEREGKKK